MKRTLLVVLIAASMVMGIYAQAANSNSSASQQDPKQVAQQQLQTFNQAVQSADTYSKDQHSQLDTGNGNYVNMDNLRTFNSYQARLKDQQATVDKLHAYYDSLIKQNAPTTSIDKALKNVQNALSRYDNIKLDFTAWVASITPSSSASSSGAAAQ
jgi:hypothetical protein